MPDRIELILRLTATVALDDVRIGIQVSPELAVASDTIPAVIALRPQEPQAIRIAIQGTPTAVARVEVVARASFFDCQVGDLAVVYLAMESGTLAEVAAASAPEAGDPAATQAAHESNGGRRPGLVGEHQGRMGSVTARGSFAYSDHAVDPVGVSPNATEKPFRRAKLALQKQLPFGWATVSTDHTREDGTFSLSADGIVIGVDRLRTVACTVGPENDLLQVKTPSGKVYCYSSQVLLAQADTDFGARVTEDTEAGGGPVNIYDTILETYDFLSAQADAPSEGLTVFWKVGYSPRCGSCYQANTIELNGTMANGDQWDDAVISHEAGHWVMDLYAALPPDAGGQHGSCLEGTIRPNLEWSEGWATFFGSANRNASADPIIALWSSHYLDTAGGIGTQTLNFNCDLETLSILDAVTGRGGFCEWQVAATLWDVIDSPADGADALAEPFSSTFTAFETRYNQHFPYNINQWWYGWTNTLGNRSGDALASRYEMIDNFASHNVDVGVRFELTWGAIPPDLDSHLWLPEATPFHEFWDDCCVGFFGNFPFSDLDHDDTNGFGPENLWVTSPYPGKYVYAVFDWTDQDNETMHIAGTGATVRIVDGSIPQYPYKAITVPVVGTGDWWNVLEVDGASGRYAAKNVVQVDSPGPYDPGPGVALGSGRKRGGSEVPRRRGY